MSLEKLLDLPCSRIAADGAENSNKGSGTEATLGALRASQPVVYGKLIIWRILCDRIRRLQRGLRDRPVEAGTRIITCFLRSKYQNIFNGFAVPFLPLYEYCCTLTSMKCFCVYHVRLDCPQCVDRTYAEGVAELSSLCPKLQNTSSVLSTLPCQVEGIALKQRKREPVRVLGIIRAQRMLSIVSFAFLSRMRRRWLLMFGQHARRFKVEGI